LTRAQSDYDCRLDYRPDIDGLRAIAVLAVVAFHAVPARISGGFVGVDVFFVISGFLISGIILQRVESGAWSVWAFYSRRIRRIFPALALVLLVTLAIGWWLLIPRSYSNLGLQVVGGSLFFSNFLFWWQTGYFDTTATEKPLLHLWSLGVEEQFYLLWPATLALIWRFLRWPMAWIFCAALTSLSVSIWYAQEFPAAGFYSPASRLWELMVGSLLAAVHVSRQNNFTRFTAAMPIMGICGLVLIVGSFFVLSKDMPYPGTAALVPTLGAAMLILAGPQAWLNNWLLSTRPIVFIGLISYPLYLWHWPLISYVSVYGPESTGLLRLLKSGALMVAFLAAVCTYYFLELPIRRYQLRRVAVVMSVAMIAIATVGAILYLEGGAPKRFNDAELSLLKQAETEESVFNSRLRPGCFLERNEVHFSNNCRGGPNADVFLWGDSHAADLYAGLTTLIDKPGEKIAMFTVGACPPVAGFQITKGCLEINQQVLDQIDAIRPNFLILSAFWTLYYKTPEFTALLKSTIDRVKSKAARVILVGPAVSFPKRQVSYLLGWQSLPLMAENTFLPDLRAADELLRNLTTETGVWYVSPISDLCEGVSCFVLIPDRMPLRLFSFDYGHLTTWGSEFYNKKYIEPLLRSGTPSLAKNSEPDPETQDPGGRP
jgi:peptidoglycan/LPS O-acetylase OafA/YrhL